MTDDEIITALQKGGNDHTVAKAYSILMGKEYRNMIRKFLLQNNGSEADVDVIHCDTITDLYDNIQRGRYKKTASVKTYIYTIARNKWHKELKQRGKTVLIVDTEVPDEEPDRPADAEIQMQLMVQRLMAEFSQAHKDCAVLLQNIFFDRIGDSEIAARENIECTTVRTRRLRCLNKARRMAVDMGLQFDSFITTTYGI
ncbi:RNA polymerase sigma factor [Rhodoflexus sp.]